MTQVNFTVDKCPYLFRIHNLTLHKFACICAGVFVAFPLWPATVRTLECYLSALLKKTTLFSAHCVILLAWLHKLCLPVIELRTLRPGKLSSTTVFIVFRIIHCSCWLRSKAEHEDDRRKGRTYMTQKRGQIKYTMLTLRLLMSYIYGAPILDVSRSHTTTQHSR